MAGIYLVGRGKVKEGKLDAVRKALDAAIDIVRRDEPGIAFYEHTIDDTGAWLGVEKYADSEALKAHIAHPTVGPALGEFMANCNVENVTIVGDISPDALDMMKPFNATYLGKSMGFAREEA